ncbi:MAG: RNA polymerase sigma factor [Actinomycetota bacterium]
MANATEPAGNERFTPETFDAVLSAAQAGAGWAASRLYQALAGRVAGYLRAQGVTDFEDATSDVFLGVFARLHTFSGTEAQFRSFVFTIAHRRVVDHRRIRARRPEVAPLDAAGGDEPSTRDATSAENAALANLGTERIRRLLGELTPDQRDVLTLRILADLSVEQTAAALGKPQGAVKALQHRALAALRKQLTREGVSR